jgi:flagellar motor switch protein FliM
MSSEILSQNDIDLLLSGGRGSAAGPRAPKAREAQLYDFRRPHRVSKDRHRTLQAMYERFAKSIEGWIMGRVRDQVVLSLQSVEQLSFGDFALSLPTPCCSFLLEVDNSGGEQGVIDFGHEFGCFLVDRMLGGRGTTAVLDRALTPIERMVIRTVAERISMALREIWSDYVRLDMTLTGFESIPEILRATGGDSPALVATVEVSAGGRSSLMSLCLPFTVLDSFFADSGKPRRSTAGTPAERAAMRRTNEASLRASNIPVSARMPDFRLPMRTIADLRPGSVLATGLPLDTAVDLLINGQPCFTGQAARVGRRLAVRVADSLGPVAAALAASGEGSVNLDP